MSVSQFLAIIRSRWLTIFAVFSVMFLAAALATFLTPKNYVAYTSLVVDIRTADPVSGGGLPVQLVPNYIATQAEIIRSSRVALRVVELLSLGQVDVLREGWMKDTNASIEIERWIAALLQKNLEVKPSRENNIVVISFSSTDANFSAQVANAFAAAYLELILQLKVEPAKQYAAWFAEQNDLLRARLADAQKRLSDYQKEHSVVLVGGLLEVESTKLSELTRQLAVAQGQQVESSSRVSDRGSADTLPEVMQSPLISSLKSDLARVESQHKQALGGLGKNHPEVVRLATDMASIKSRIEAETARVVSSLGATNRISSNRQAELSAAVDEQKQKVLALQAHIDKIALLQRDVDSANRAYELTGERLSQLSLESQSQQTNVAILNPATPPYRASSPKMATNLVLAVIFGLAMGLSVAVIMEIMVPVIRSSSDLERLPGVPFIVSVSWSADYSKLPDMKNIARPKAA